MVAKGGGIAIGGGKDAETQEMKNLEKLWTCWFAKKKHAEKEALEFCEDEEKEIM